MKIKMVPLSKVLRHRKDKITIDDATNYKLCRVQLHRRGVVLRQMMSGAKIRTKTQQVCKRGDFIVAEMDAKVGGYGFIPPELDGAIVSSHYYLYEVDIKHLYPPYLWVICQAGILQRQIVAKGSTNYASVRPYTVLSWTIPLPDMNIQIRIAENFEQFSSSLALLNDEMSHQETLLTKLKQAILQEAIQGKLTGDWRKENSDVEPASQLLECIQKEKQRLIAEKKIRKEKSLPPITSEEIPFEIPDSWEWCRFSDICINLDRERKPISKAQRERKKKVYPYYGASGIIDKIDGFTHEGRFLLIGEDGSNLRLRSKPIAFEAKGKIWVNNHAHVVKFTNTILQDFVEHKINGMDLTEFITGGFQPKLSQSNLNRIPIPLPPIVELPIILERIKSLLDFCRQLETEVKHSRTNAENLLQTVLKEAFTSKTV